MLEHASTTCFSKVPAGVRTVRFERPVPGIDFRKHWLKSPAASYRASISIKSTSFVSPVKGQFGRWFQGGNLSENDG